MLMNFYLLSKSSTENKIMLDSIMTLVTRTTDEDDNDNSIDYDSYLMNEEETIIQCFIFTISEVLKAYQILKLLKYMRENHEERERGSRREAFYYDVPFVFLVLNCNQILVLIFSHGEVLEGYYWEYIFISLITSTISHSLTHIEEQRIIVKKGYHQHMRLKEKELYDLEEAVGAGAA